MFEFKWKAPGDRPEEIVLRIHSRRGWFGRKQLFCGERSVYRRGWFEGIEVRGSPAYCGKCRCRLKGLVKPRCPECGTPFRNLFDPEGGRSLELRTLPIAGTPDWRPALFCDGQELPETTGTQPPRVVELPKSLAAVYGFTCLMMLLAVVMFPSTVRILRALHMDESGYTALQDIVPWFIPFLVTAACLLGVVNMRKRALLAFGGLIVLQGVLLPATGVPISMVALAIQVVLWLVGAAHWRQMQ